MVPIYEENQGLYINSIHTDSIMIWISYMYSFSSECGVLIFPHRDTSFIKINKIKDTNGLIKKVGLGIPQNVDNFTTFKKIMSKNEKVMKNNIILTL
ncbi:hypothetical protein SAMN05421856_101617 [Chryseobacterium taichungense]|uniref:Uncharacterized protein n=1 Tax=Chryseobacterium taichungense TaxID=295069 RepID=A0A1H7WC23_9FLAO|nr:hypothetical protein SAMN05421856_101617 [Chryseobacterium taichungense]